MTEPKINGAFLFIVYGNAFTGFLHDRRGETSSAQGRKKPQERRHKRQSNFIAGEDIPQRHHHAVKGSALAQLNLKAHHEVQTKKQIPSSLHCQRFSERNPKLFKGSRLKEPN